MLELRVESAAMALRELNLQIPSRRMGLYHKTRFWKIHGESRLGSKQNWRTENGLIKNLVFTTLQEVEQLKKIYCSEAKRAPQIKSGGSYPTRIA